MKKYLLASTLLAAAFAVTAFADDASYTGEISDVDLSTNGGFSPADTATFTEATGSWVTAGEEGTTFVANVDVESGGLTINSGSAGTYTFSGTISGEGDWTTSVAHNYIFTGDISGYTGSMTNAGHTTFNYAGEGTQTINASYIDAVEIEFAGTANYVVNGATIHGYAGSNTYQDKIIVSTSGTVTFNDVTTSQIGTVEVGASSTLLITGTCTFNQSWNNTTNNGGFHVNGTLEIGEGATLSIHKQLSNVLVANLKLDNGSTFEIYETAAPSTTNQLVSIDTVTVADNGSGKITNGNWNNYIYIGALVGSNATLTLTSSASSSLANIYELTGTGTSSFSGKIVLSDSASGNDRAVSLIISEEKVAAGAVIEMGAESSDSGSLSLGINASRVEIAGLTTTSATGGDIVYAGSISAGTDVGSAGGSITSNSETTNTLAINTATGTSYTFSGKVLDMLNLEKLGDGSQAIAFESGSSFDGTIAVKEGTLNLSGVAIDSSGITVAEDAVLSIGNTITLAAESSSTISGTVTLGESGTLSVGTDATLTLDTTLGTSDTGTVEFSAGATLILTDAFLASAAEQDSMAIIMANSITYDGESLTTSLEAFLEDCIDFDDDKFDVTFSYSGGVLSAEVTYVPEPELFSVFLGIGALGLIATRRRRR